MCYLHNFFDGTVKEIIYDNIPCVTLAGHRIETHGRQSFSVSLV